MSERPARKPSLLERYVPAVWRHGVSLLTGVLVSAGTWILDTAVREKWVHIDWWVEPPITFYVITGLLTLVLAQFLAWRELESERNEAKKKADQLSAQVEQLETDVDRLQTAGLLSIERQVRRPARMSLLGRMAKRVSIQTFLDTLSYAEPKHAYADRRFAVLRVSNESGKNLPGLVAQCSIAGTEEEIHAVWSKKSGKAFVSGGSHAADLNAGDSRLLVIAQALEKERVWCLLPSRGSIHDGPVGRISRPEIYSRDGELLSKGSELEVVIWFKSQGFSQPERVRLAFNDEGATIEHQRQEPPNSTLSHSRTS